VTSDAHLKGMAIVIAKSIRQNEARLEERKTALKLGICNCKSVYHMKRQNGNLGTPDFI
jgi:hypothetical protein